MRHVAQRSNRFIVSLCNPDAFREAREKAADLRGKIVNDPRDPQKVIQDVFNQFYKDEMTIYTRENIMNCAKLVAKRAKE